MYLPPVKNIKEIDVLSEKNIDETDDNNSRKKRPTSPVMRSPAYALRGVESAGNLSLDKALKNIKFLPKNFIISDNDEILMLYGTDNGGYQILIKMDQDNMINVGNESLHLKEIEFKNDPIAKNDINTVKLLTDGIAYFKEGGILYFISQNYGKCWLIKETDKRPLPSEIPIPVVLYTTLISRPRETEHNVRLSIDRILSHRYLGIKDDIDKSRTRLNIFCKKTNKTFDNIEKIITELYFSLIKLYIFRASHNQDFRRNNKKIIKLITKTKKWEDLEDIYRNDVYNTIREAIEVIVTKPKDVIKYNKTIKNIRLRIEKIDKIITHKNEIISICNDLDYSLIEENDLQIVELGIDINFAQD